MFGGWSRFLARLVGGGSGGAAPDSSPSKNNYGDLRVPPTDRRSVVEGSAEPTYLCHGDALRAQVVRLSTLEVKIIREDACRSDVVEELWRGFRGREFPALTQVNQFLVAKTITELCKRADSEISKRTFVLGAVEPASVRSAAKMVDFVRQLTGGYPHFNDLVAEFESTHIVGENFRGQTFDAESLQKLAAPRHTSVGSEPNARARIDLVKIVAASFERLGEPISFGRMKLLNPHIPALANCPADRRDQVIRKILMSEYPFNRENESNWSSEIGTLMQS